MSTAALLSDYGANALAKLRGISSPLAKRIRSRASDVLDPAKAFLSSNIGSPAQEALSKYVEIAERDALKNRRLAAGVAAGGLATGAGIGKLIGQPVLEGFQRSIPSTAGDMSLYGRQLLQRMDAKNLEKAKSYIAEVGDLAKNTAEGWAPSPGSLQAPQSALDAILNPTHSALTEKAINTLYPGASELAGMMAADRTANYFTDNVLGMVPLGVGAGANLTTLARQVTSMSGLGEPAIQQSIRDSILKPISGQLRGAKQEGLTKLKQLYSDAMAKAPGRIIDETSASVDELGRARAYLSSDLAGVREFLSASQPDAIKAQMDSALARESAAQLAKLKGPEYSAITEKAMGAKINPLIEGMRAKLDNTLGILRKDYPYIPISEDLTTATGKGIMGIAAQEAATKALEKGLSTAAASRIGQKVQTELVERLATRVGQEIAEKAVLTGAKQVPFIGTVGALGAEGYNAYNTYNFARLLENNITPRNTFLKPMVDSLSQGPAKAMYERTYDPDAIASALSPLKEHLGKLLGESGEAIAKSIAESGIPDTFNPELMRHGF
jgi:hypothetical protein